ncbi:MAG: retropepsin-like aspartic protease, partial [Collinsella sp.]
MRLEPTSKTTNSGPILSSDPAACFIISVQLGDNKLGAKALIDSGASACFMDRAFAQQNKILLVQKPKAVQVEAIDGRPLSSGDVTEETTSLLTTTGDHVSHITYNVIDSPSNPVILGLSWLEHFNPQIDWSSRSINFPAKVKAPERINLKKPLLVGARAFMKAAKEGSIFAIYATPISEPSHGTSRLPHQYAAYQDVFEKKNADVLPQHRPYDCAIDTVDSAQIPF